MIKEEKERLANNESSKESSESNMIDEVEFNIIFGAIQPIYEIHRHILSELQLLVLKWDEECLIGNVVARQVLLVVSMNLFD